MGKKCNIVATLLAVVELLFVAVSCQMPSSGVGGSTPQVYYANIGNTVTLQCQGGGQYACFSTYTFQNTYHSMVPLNSSLKYQLQSGGAITVVNVQASDAGYYACSSNCLQMKASLISYYLQPMCNLDI